MPDEVSAGTESTAPSLAWLALRYAAGELTGRDAEAFEARLGEEQEAREALSEAMRLSAAAAGVAEAKPDPLVREAIRDRLSPTWLSKAMPRRAYRGHPGLWLGMGCTIAVAGTLAWNSIPRLPVNEDPYVPTPMWSSGAIAATDSETTALPVGSGVPNSAQAMSPSKPSTKLNPMGMIDHNPFKVPMVPVEPNATASTRPTVQVPMALDKPDRTDRAVAPMPVPAADPVNGAAIEFKKS